ncbi:hypothetical protein [Bacteroides eggerthii]|uniref:hypothetical protein n=1 Tax=Bacteroides eggerthii TaxID=28111 RepID=UPI00189DEFA7|nr:hypothetical protein [Bacteroides eggerthii]
MESNLKTGVDFIKECLEGIASVSPAAKDLHLAAIDLALLDEKTSEVIQNEDADNEEMIEFSKLLNEAISLSLQIAGELIHKKLNEERLTK